MPPCYGDSICIIKALARLFAFFNLVIGYFMFNNHFITGDLVSDRA